MRVTVTVALVLAGTLALSIGTEAQGPQRIYPPPAPPPQGSGRIAGRVLAADSGQPLANATVSVSMLGNSAVRQTTVTREDGRWEVIGLPDGAYSVGATRTGYFAHYWGQVRPFSSQPTKPVRIERGQAVGNIDLRLIRAGAISGFVFDDRGDPAMSAHVQVSRSVYVDGERRLQPIGHVSVAGGLVDDRGQFRIYGLPPGEYFLSATSGPFGNVPFGVRQDGTSFAPTFYPGTPSATSAAPVAVDAGRETNVTFNLTRVRVAKISGKAVDSQARPLAGGGAKLYLPSARTEDEAPQTGIRADGSFSFDAVLPGSYVLRISSPNDAGAAQQFAAMPIVVDGNDIEGLVLEVTRGITATGRVISADGGVLPTAVTVSAYPLNPETAMRPYTGVRPGADGVFMLRNLFGRQIFRVSVPAAADWFVKSISIGGRDVTDAEFDFEPGRDVGGIQVALTQRLASLTGTADDERNAPVTDYSVVAFSTDERKWTFRSRFVRRVDSNEEGRFVLKGLPAGEYYAVALPLLEPGQETDPDRLRAWRAKATRVTLAEQEVKPIALKLSVP